MGYTSGEITGNVTIPDVQKALVTSSTNVVALCQHRNIVKYSRHKPYAFGGILPNGLYGAGGFDDSLILANNFGMTGGMIVWPTKAIGSQDINDCLERWGQWRSPSGKRKVDAPSQKEDEPCRLGDFRGYRPATVKQLDRITITSREIGTSGGSATALDYLTIISGRAVEVELRIVKDSLSGILFREMKTPDGKSFEDLYLTMVVLSYNSTSSKWGEYYLVAQSENKLLDMGINNGFYWRVGLGYSATQLENLLQNSDNKVFIAVGLAEEISNAVKPSGRVYSYPTTLLSNFSLANIKLYNLDAWNDYDITNFVAIQQAFTLNYEMINFNLNCAVQNLNLNKTQPTFTVQKISANAQTGQKKGLLVKLNDKFMIRTVVSNSETGANAHLYVSPDNIGAGNITVLYQFRLYVSNAASELNIKDLICFASFLTRQGLDPNYDDQGVGWENRTMTISQGAISGSGSGGSQSAWNAMDVVGGTSSDAAAVVGEAYRKKFFKDEDNWTSYVDFISVAVNNGKALVGDATTNGIFIPVDYDNFEGIALETRCIRGFGTTNNTPTQIATPIIKYESLDFNPSIGTKYFEDPKTDYSSPTYVAL